LWQLNHAPTNTPSEGHRIRIHGLSRPIDFRLRASVDSFVDSRMHVWRTEAGRDHGHWCGCKISGGCGG
jgi:hypothetical protein